MFWKPEASKTHEVIFLKKKTNAITKTYQTENELLKNQSNRIDILATLSKQNEDDFLSLSQVPLDISLVVDRSGSIEGGPIEQIKICVIKW